MKKVQIGLIAIGMMAVGQINAQEAEQKAKPTPEQRFERMDKNKDGVLTMDEMQAKKEEKADKKAASFKKMDTNADGNLSREEFMIAAKNREEHRAAKAAKGKKK